MKKNTNRKIRTQLLDIGSGRNPFMFSLPEAVTMNLPAGKFRTSISGFDSNPLDFADPHITGDATVYLPFEDCTVKNIMMHHVVGYASFGVINPDGLALLAGEALRILCPGGSLYIKSAFSCVKTQDWSLHTPDFIQPLIAAGFDLNNIDLIYSWNAEDFPIAERILEESARLDGIQVKETNCCFIVASKREA